MAEHVPQVLISRKFYLKYKDSTRSTSASNAVTKSRTEAMTHIPQIITYAVVEKETGLKGRQTCASTCCACRKGTSWDEVMLNNQVKRV